MPTVQLTRHLYSFFPALEGKELRFESAANVATINAVVRCRGIFVLADGDLNGFRRDGASIRRSANESYRGSSEKGG